MKGRIVKIIICVILFAILAIGLIFFICRLQSEKKINDLKAEYQKTLRAIDVYEYEGGQFNIQFLRSDNIRTRSYEAELINGYYVNVDFLNLIIYLHNLYCRDKIRENYFYDVYDEFEYMDDEELYEWDLIWRHLSGGRDTEFAKQLLGELYDIYYYNADSIGINKEIDELNYTDWMNILEWAMEQDISSEYEYISTVKEKIISMDE